MNDFPSLMQPEGSLYCGPYCVVACLQAFGLLPQVLPINMNKYNHADKEFNGELVEITSKLDLDALAKEIYTITGIVTKGENPSYIEHSGFNSLASMLYVIGKLGLNTEVVISDDSKYSYLNSIFPTEFELMGKLNVPITVLNQQSTRLSDSILISVIAYPDTLHYVANNDKGEWFDSGLEEHLFHWDAIENWDTSCNKREKASWLGISIRVSNK